MISGTRILQKILNDLRGFSVSPTITVSWLILLISHPKTKPSIKITEIGIRPVTEGIPCLCHSWSEYFAFAFVVMRYRALGFQGRLLQIASCVVSSEKS